MTIVLPSLTDIYELLTLTPDKGGYDNPLYCRVLLVLSPRAPCFIVLEWYRILGTAYYQTLGREPLP